ncbi:ABC transporter permease [Microlunatus ginsengisoli]|jgi:NitT/TauT family transport system permease protein|uniref:ABC transporter permease n=1 Tax=Microlunatus ginsengisoli TaxID=363863 RepID=A0ABP7AQH8_9ACTN
MTDVPAGGLRTDATTTIPSRVLAGGSAVRSVVAPIVLGAIVIVAWQALVVGLQIEPFVLPSPSAIGHQFVANLDNVLAGAARTGLNALIGLVVGAVLGVLGAVLANIASVLDGMAAPLVAALSVMPIVALAPVLYTMYGADVEAARQIVAGLAVLIPVYLNTLRGLRQVKPVHRDLMRAYAASAGQQQWAVTLPTAAPYVFTGLRIGASLAVISALVAEYFGGPVTGLGKSITSAAASSNYPLAWAYVLGAILLGLVFYGATLGLERWVTRHRSS